MKAVMNVDEKGRRRLTSLCRTPTLRSGFGTERIVRWSGRHHGSYPMPSSWKNLDMSLMSESERTPAIAGPGS